MGVVPSQSALTLVLALLVTLRSGPRSRHLLAHLDRVSVSVCYGVRVTPGTAVQSGTDRRSVRAIGSQSVRVRVSFFAASHTTCACRRR